MESVETFSPSVSQLNVVGRGLFSFAFSSMISPGKQLFFRLKFSLKLREESGYMVSDRRHHYRRSVSQYMILPAKAGNKSFSYLRLLFEVISEKSSCWKSCIIFVIGIQLRSAFAETNTLIWLNATFVLNPLIEFK